MPKNREHYIQVDKDLWTDPRTYEAAKKLGEIRARSRDVHVLGTHELRAMYIGTLLAFWCYADTYIRADDTLPCGPDALDMLFGIRGFCEATPTCWLEVIDDHTVHLPGYCKKNNVVGRAERKAQRAEYMRWKREQERDGHVTGTRRSRDAHVTLNTNTLEEKEKNSLRSFQKKATRLPKDWKPDATQHEFAIEAGVQDVDRTAAMFVDYWLAAPDKQGRKLDWDATWRNWCRREAQQNRARPATPRAWSTRPTQESALAAIDAAYADSPPDEGADVGQIRIEG